MTEAKRSLKVFLCHAHADRDPVRGLYSRLTQDGVDAWLDKAKLLPGQDWELEIRKAVREADVVVVCLSKQFNQAGFRQKEVRLALDTAMEKPEGEIFIIPARLEECDNLESLRKWHWVDLFDKDGYPILMRTLRVRAEAIGAVVEPVPVKKSPRLSPSNPAGANSIPYYLREIDEEKGNSVSASLKSAKSSSEQGATSQPTHKSKKKFPKLKTEYIVAIIGAAATIIAGILSSPLIGKWFTPVSMPASTLAVIVTSAPTLLDPLPTVTVEPTIRPSPTALPLELTDANNVQMVLVPAGEFKMGSEDGPEFDQPVNIVYLNSYYIDKYEVSNALYKACVDANVCTPPKQSEAASRESYYGNPGFDDYPVISVNWYQADEYCKWRGGSLPSEEQWEKAARGENDFLYPWGNTFNPALLNFCDKNCPMSWAAQAFDDGYEDTAPVATFEGGQSPYGAFNMSGNVYEWTLNWYDVYPGGNANADDGFGETSRVVRGGSWFDGDYMLRADHRFKLTPDDFEDIVGFRCARSIE